MRDTIFAPATAPGRAAIAVVRISGPRSYEIGKLLTGKTLTARTATTGTLRNPEDGAILDVAVATFFAAPRSYTGEDCLELSTHGGDSVVRDLVRSLHDLGLRLADPGEFTRRAFEAGKLDLIEAEAVADLIDADTSAQRLQALDQLNGRVSRQYERWRRSLIEGSAELEAVLDFPDEDVSDISIRGISEKLLALVQELKSAIEDQSGEQIREGFRVAIIGQPNAGKSSLLNALVKREAAIVTPLPGTTRDVIEIQLVLAGYKLLIADTAGLRVPGDIIELEGIRRARAWAKGAQLRLLVTDQNAYDFDEGLFDALSEPSDVLVRNKTDLEDGPANTLVRHWAATRNLQTVSTQAAAGEVQELLEILKNRVVSVLGESSPRVVTRARHRTALSRAVDHLGRASAAISPDRMADDIRLASRCLEELVGRIGSETILDKVFSDFCIGK